MDVLSRLRGFINDVRQMGITVGVSQIQDCFAALLLVDWSKEPYFYTALSCTLLKDAAHLPIFNELYLRHFHPWRNSDSKDEELTDWQGIAEGLAFSLGGRGASEQQREHPNDCREVKQPTHRIQKDIRQQNPLRRDFYEATYLCTPDEVRRMEQMVPLLAKRMASRMIIKQKRNQMGSIDFRRTMRMSMNYGGIPIDLGVKKRHRENPVIFALCDVSWSCLPFSYFSLAIVYALEKFFRQVRSFAFIEQTDEITNIVRQEPYQNLRAQTISQANVSGKSGYTDYGSSLSSFYQQYGRELTARSQVLIFGDARTNWFLPQADVLREIRGRVKRVYWFNPEPEADWGNGDSSMLAYKKHCNKVFECANLEQLASAICEIN